MPPPAGLHPESGVTMVAFLTFLQDYEMVLNYLLGLVALWYAYHFLAAQVRLAKSKFGLERELFQDQRNAALGRLALILLAAAGIYAAVKYGLPEAQRVERLRAEAVAVNLPTITPTPTPLELFGIDVSGCNNPQARIVRPSPGEAVKGKVEILIVADIANFAFYKLELYRSDEPEALIPLFSDDVAATEEEPHSWTWDSSTVTPGVYHLQLTVLDAELNFPKPCVVPLQVLEGGL
jgi:hypothetical protein